MNERAKLLAMLAEAGAELQAELSAHDVSREAFDAFPGEAQSSPRADSVAPAVWKTGTIGKRLTWTVYLTYEGRDDAETA